jgi:hypothetical protein
VSGDEVLRSPRLPCCKKLLVVGRYLPVVPVIGSLLLTVEVALMGAGLIVERAGNSKLRVERRT